MIITYNFESFKYGDKGYIVQKNYGLLITIELALLVVFFFFVV